MGMLALVGGPTELCGHSQKAADRDLKSAQCRFESDWGTVTGLVDGGMAVARPFVVRGVYRRRAPGAVGVVTSPRRVVLRSWRTQHTPNPHHLGARDILGHPYSTVETRQFGVG